MIRTIEDFLTSWKFETESTLKVFRALTDASLEQRVTPEGRTLGFLAWHIIATLTEMLGNAGVAVKGPTEKDPIPAAAGLAEAFEQGAARVAEAVKANWTDAQLTDEVNMYGENWRKGVVLSALMAHQTHHRGQMTVLMRQAGLVVPGVYGPAREEWAAYGMQPMP